TEKIAAQKAAKVSAHQAGQSEFRKRLDNPRDKGVWKIQNSGERGRTTVVQVKYQNSIVLIYSIQLKILVYKKQMNN
ncbi:unnamed protein product, partial [Brachionus calyciflorus]